jgi:hypothetical protein
VKRILPILVVGILGVGTAMAQSPASAQSSTAGQAQASAQANKSGAQASGNGSASTASSASTNAGKNSATGKGSADISSGTKIDATLANSLDAKKNKPGDRVEARTAQDVKQDGKVVLKKGTRLVGHVTEVQARSKEQTESQLGVVFEHALTNSGQEIPLNATIQALAAAQSSEAASAGADDLAASGSGLGSASGSARSSGGGLVGGVASTAGSAGGAVMNTAGSASGNAGGTLGAATRSTGAVGGLSSTGRLASNSSGVFGLQGLSINSAASSAAQGSTIVSSTKNVHLDSGTQMLLSVSGQAQ